MNLERYGVFKQEHDGPIWRAFFDDADEAKAEAKRLAQEEQSVFFVYSFINYSEVARFKPSNRGRAL